MEPPPEYSESRYRRSHDRADAFWEEVEPRLPSMKSIITAHFGSACRDLTSLAEGAYARVYEISLDNGERFVLRVVLPVRDGLKTEAEVATMDSVRARTSIPVPKVHLFCSTRANPLGAEWIIMDFLPGERFIDCWAGLSPTQKHRAANDLSKVMHELYTITSTHCGSLLEDRSLLPDQRAQRFGDRPQLPPTVESCTSSGDFTIGPANDFPFIETFFPAPYDRCGPFRSERQYLEAVACANILDTDADVIKARRWPYEKVLEVYDRVHEHYSRDINLTLGHTPSPNESFRLCHGDISISNLLLDRSTGGISGVIDWEVSGFRPAWLAAGSGEWLEDEDEDEDEDEEKQDQDVDIAKLGEDTDVERPSEDTDIEQPGEDDDSVSYFRHRVFFQDPPRSGSLELREEHEIREYFVAQLAACCSPLAHDFEHGVELRAIYQALRLWLPGDVINWLQNYQKMPCLPGEDSPLPFDFMAWFMDHRDLWERLYDAGIQV